MSLVHPAAPCGHVPVGVHRADAPANAPSAGRSVFDLADLACAMPWKDKAPISARLDFKSAVTPELFVELVTALRSVCAVIEQGIARVPLAEFGRVMQAADDAIAKALGQVAPTPAVPTVSPVLTDSGQVDKTTS